MDNAQLSSAIQLQILSMTGAKTHEFNVTFNDYPLEINEAYYAYNISTRRHFHDL